MSLQKQIREDMLAAMKARDTETVSLLRVVAGEFGREMKTGKELSDEEALKIIRTMSENAKELGNQREVDILDKYLPQMFDKNHIVLIVNEIIQQNGYSGMQDMGKVMAGLKSPSIDNKIASQIAKELLSK